MATLKDIANYLNVSVSTVSRVANNRNRVDTETRKKISEALQKYNYQPDENARRLRTNISNVIGVIVPDISNPFYATVLKGIENVTAKEGYSVLVCNTDENKEREKNAVNLLLRQKVVGIIVATIFDDADAVKFYSGVKPSVVFFDNVPAAEKQINSVTIDNIRASKELVEYMLANGHRQIFMIAGPSGESSSEKRLLGWKAALKDAGIKPDSDWVIHGNFREDSGMCVMKEFLNRKDRPTAVCVANNFMAYGAVKAIYEAGLSIPEDISLGAFDIIDTTGLMKLQITTMLEPAEEIGMVAANICMKFFGVDSGVKVSRHMVLEHNFLKNNTVMALRQQKQPIELE